MSVTKNHLIIKGDAAGDCEVAVGSDSALFHYLPPTCMVFL